MKTVLRTITILVISTFAFTGCNFQEILTTTNYEASQTAVAQTVVVLQTSIVDMTATVRSTGADLNLPNNSTLTPEPISSMSLMPTATPANIPDFKVANVIDITVPDNTSFNPGETFTKTWRMTNGGSSPWTSDFKLIFVSGDSLAASTSVPLSQTVAPNQTIDISIEMTAPATEGSYISRFMLQTNDGKNFGIGPNGADAFWAKIVVQTFFQVKSAVIVPDVTAYTGSCPGVVQLSAKIESTAPGTVTYYFATSTGNSSTYTLEFSAAGVKTSDPIDWQVTGPETLIVHVYVDQPNHQGFADLSIPVSCTP